MSPGRTLAGALIFAAHLVFAPVSHADSEPRPVAHAAQAARGLGSTGSSLSTKALAALLSAGFVPVIFMFARERKQRRGD